MTVTHAIQPGGASTPAADDPRPASAAAMTLPAPPSAAALPAGYPRYIVPEPNRFTRFFLRLHDRSPRWAAPAAIAVCFGGVASWVLVANPADAGASDVSTCVVKMTTGLDCPGCGGTRAFFYLLNGNIPEAVRHHMMAVFAAPFLVWLYLGWAVKQIWGRKLPVPTVTAKTVSVFLAAWMVFMVARNLPFAPFTTLYV
jgi:hypothetical protein